MKKSVFAADLRVYGDVASKGDLDVLGHIEGTVSVKDLVVTRDAAIEGHVRAASATVAGTVVGSLDSDHVAIESTGRVEGDLTYRTLSMLVGGALNARCVPWRTEQAGASPPDANATTARRQIQQPRESAGPSRGRAAPAGVTN